MEHFERYEDPFELLSLSWVIASSEPHVHAMISDVRSAYGGHLEHGSRVLYLCEIAIGVLSGISMRRRLTPIPGEHIILKMLGGVLVHRERWQ